MNIKNIVSKVSTHVGKGKVWIDEKSGKVTINDRFVGTWSSKRNMFIYKG